MYIADLLHTTDGGLRPRRWGPTCQRPTGKIWSSWIPWTRTSTLSILMWRNGRCITILKRRTVRSFLIFVKATFLMVDSSSTSGTICITYQKGLLDTKTSIALNSSDYSSEAKSHVYIPGWVTFEDPRLDWLSRSNPGWWVWVAGSWLKAQAI